MSSRARQRILMTRAAGATFDGFVSNPDVNDCPLEAITVPTLLVHAQDDPLTSHDAAERAAISAFLAKPVTTPRPGPTKANTATTWSIPNGLRPTDDNKEAHHAQSRGALGDRRS